jgi:hypothetical protein
MLLPLLLAAVSATTPTAPQDCSLNGEFTANACVCDKPWSGADCSQLADVRSVTGIDLIGYVRTSNVSPITENVRILGSSHAHLAK